MDRLARLLRFATLALVLGGLAAVAWLDRPSSLAEGLNLFRNGFLPALLQPLPLVALAVALVSGFLTRRLERGPEPRAPGPTVHHIPTPGSTATDAATSTTPPRSLVAPEPTKGSTDLALRRLRAEIEGQLTGRRPDVPAFVDGVLRAAVDLGASDVHWLPLDLSTRISLRVGGELDELATAPQAHHAEIVRRLKVLSGLVTYQSQEPQDGRFTLDSPRGTVDLRVSIVPTHHGEKVVLRLARLDPSLFELDRLGLPAEVLNGLSERLADPQGVIVLTGPTGSGKTTTLYAALNHLHQTRGATTNLATLEDPVEVELPFLSQTQVRTAQGFGFPEALRAVLRQDPDVLMVGEIRDRETAGTAVQAALSGHLILTTLHADSTLGVFPRLIDLGVEPFLAASALTACLAQRLGRRLCPSCRRPAPPSRSTVERLTARGIAIDGLGFFVAEGCSACGGSGHRGRLAIFEWLAVTPELRRAVTERQGVDRLAEVAGLGRNGLLQAAVARATQGELSLDEALRVAG